MKSILDPFFAIQQFKPDIACDQAHVGIEAAKREIERRSTSSPDSFPPDRVARAHDSKVSLLAG